MIALDGNILVLDEGAGFCRNVAAKLAARGCNAYFSFDVLSATNRLTEGKTDMVVMSCAGKSPCNEIIAQIRALSANIPVMSFEAPECGRKCTTPENTHDVRIITLGSWDAQKASQHAYDGLGEIMKLARSKTVDSQLLFGKGELVDIKVTGLNKTGTLKSTILQRDDRFLYLSEITDSSNTTCEVPLKANIRVGVAGRDAHYGFTSQVFENILEPVPMVKIGKPVVIYSTQRRKHPRFSMKLPVRVAIYSEDSETEPARITGVTKEISRGGVTITSPEYVEPGEIITLNLIDPSNDRNTTGLAYVLRTDSGNSDQQDSFELSCRFSRVDENIDLLLEPEQ